MISFYLVFILLSGLSACIAERDDCPTICPQVYQPICGVTGNGQKYKLFMNSCQMRVENCKAKEKWTNEMNFSKCQGQTDFFNENLSEEVIPKNEGCPTFCPQYYNPVCGFNGKEYRLFDNECVMEAFNCTEKGEWLRIKEMMPCLIKKQSESNKTSLDMCEDIFLPICGKEGHQLKLFKNECFFKVENELTKNKWKKYENLYECFLQTYDKKEDELVESSTIDNEPVTCSKSLRPICAFNGTTYRLFDNDCVYKKQNRLENYQWTYVNNLILCLARIDIYKDAINCPEICPAIENPVCGFDGKTFKFFPNECELKRENCESQRNWQITKNLLDCEAFS